LVGLIFLFVTASRYVTIPSSMPSKKKKENEKNEEMTIRSDARILIESLGEGIRVEVTGTKFDLLALMVAFFSSNDLAVSVSLMALAAYYDNKEIIDEVKSEQMVTIDRTKVQSTEQDFEKMLKKIKKDKKKYIN
jgi:hypothetical protein